MLKHHSPIIIIKSKTTEVMALLRSMTVSSKGTPALAQRPIHSDSIQRSLSRRLRSEQICRRHFDVENGFALLDRRRTTHMSPARHRSFKGPHSSAAPP